MENVPQKEKGIKSLDRTYHKVKRKLKGDNQNSGWVLKGITYLLLISIGFVYIYPLIHMVTTSFKSLDDLLDASIKLLPSGFYIKNYKQAFSVMNIQSSLFGSIMISLVPTLIQVVITGFVGYGFARYEFKFKKTLIFLMVFGFIIPPQILMMPTYVLYNDLGILGSIKAFIVPAFFGQGLRSAIFILIYYQFFKQTPNSLYEAARVDGASEWKCFYRIAIPMAIPAIIIVFLFSFVWYWNETYLTNLYLSGAGKGFNWTTILIQLQQFKSNYESMYPVTANTPNKINEGITMAGTVISILPLLITYFFVQRYFVESIDNSGITGE